MPDILWSNNNQLISQIKTINKNIRGKDKDSNDKDGNDTNPIIKFKKDNEEFFARVSVTESMGSTYILFYYYDLVDNNGFVYSKKGEPFFASSKNLNKITIVDGNVHQYNQFRTIDEKNKPKSFFNLSGGKRKPKKSTKNQRKNKKQRKTKKHI